MHTTRMLYVMYVHSRSAASLPDRRQFKIGRFYLQQGGGVFSPKLSTRATNARVTRAGRSLSPSQQRCRERSPWPRCLNTGDTYRDHGYVREEQNSSAAAAQHQQEKIPHQFICTTPCPHSNNSSDAGER